MQYFYRSQIELDDQLPRVDVNLFEDNPQNRGVINNLDSAHEGQPKSSLQGPGTQKDDVEYDLGN